ncbi:MAG: type II toxin-antitoxin system RelE/ParE family toxin [Verrucomicrobiales bacterium]|nr:type II toxin-antitoxin system RelE/ParE family toxin [Verrucomicrobiales bacterium]
MEHAMHRILLHPEAWTPLSQEHRRCRLRRFPYGVVYSVEEDTVLVAAVFHCHRHPDSWKHRT